MTDRLVDEVVPADRVLFCRRCEDMVAPVLSRSGVHIRADCPECGRYVKFVRQVSEHPRYAEPDLYDGEEGTPW